MVKTLLSMPYEILGIICSILEDEYKPGLLKFSQTNRVCYQAANKLRFKKIYIRPAHSKRLAAEVERWTDILSRTNSWPYVKQLELDEPCVGLYTDPEGLTSLLNFVPKLFLLEDLIYACKDPFPPALLQVLHECLPRCRLHLMSFDLESSPDSPTTSVINSANVTPDTSAPATPTTPTAPAAAAGANANNGTGGAGSGADPATAIIDEDKLALASSPSLHTIVVQSAMLRPLTVNEDIALHMAAGLAPNLKRVNILTWYYDRAPKRLSHVSEDSNNQDALACVFKDRDQGSLEGLSLPPVGLDQFIEWEEKVDFSKLRTLRLWSATTEMLERASQCNFSSLKTFGVSFDSKGESFNEIGRKLIKSLPALENLYLGYYSEAILGTALKYHGHSLQKLYIQGAVSPEDVREIGLHDTQLHDLTILFQCSGSDTCEEFCDAIGTIQHLRTLSITADVYRGTGTPDEKWARDLFTTITRYNRTLQKAQIRPFANNIRYDCFRFNGMNKAEEDRIVVHKADVWRSSDRYFKTMFY